MEIPIILNRFEVKNEAGSDVAEMYLYGTISSYSWMNEDGSPSNVTAKNVKNELNKIAAKTIKVHISSSGGDAFESIAINNLLKQSEATIEIYIDGLAGSGASVVSMAGKVFMPSNAMMMVHKASTYAMGNADELRKTATDLDKIDIAVKESYKTKFVGTDEELTSLIADATWLTAQECFDLGFCDEIIAEIPPSTEPQISTKDTIVNKYKKEIVIEVPPVVEVVNPVVDELPKVNINNLMEAFVKSFK